MPHPPSPGQLPGTFALGRAQATVALSAARAQALQTQVAVSRATALLSECARVDTAGLDWDGALHELRKAGAL